MISNHAGPWSSFARGLYKLLYLVLLSLLLPPIVLLAGLRKLLVLLLLALARYATLLLLLMLALALAWVLSGCGTAPLPVPTRLQVPAALLIAPAQPVPLILGSGLRMPGKTTLPMPSLVPPTGPGSSN